MKDRDIKLEAVTPNTLVVGVDIAKEIQWARFVNYRGLELGKALKFRNNKNGFDSILASIEAICKNKRFDNVIVGMEPTGHYWKPLANYLIMHETKVVLVNPYHTNEPRSLTITARLRTIKKTL